MQSSTKSGPEKKNRSLKELPYAKDTGQEAEPGRGLPCSSTLLVAPVSSEPGRASKEN